MNTRVWVAVLAGAVVVLTTGCPPKKPQEKLLTVEPRAEIAADQDALVVTGQGVAPADKPAGQGRLMAQRAAKMDALRQLAAVVGDFRMKSTASGAQINIEGFVQDAQEVQASYDSTNGIARVTLRLPLNGIGGVAKALGYDRILVASAAATQQKP
jgi:hypothetical protein